MSEPPTPQPVPPTSQEHDKLVRAAKLVRAKQQVAAIKCFYVHVLVFLLVIAGLLGLNLMLGSPGWVQWPFLGWGIGLATHAFCVFRRPPTPASKRMQGLISAWEDRTIRKLMDE